MDIYYSCASVNIKGVISMSKYVSIRNKLASCAEFISANLKARDHEVESVYLDLLHNDCREEVHVAVMIMFEEINDLFNDLIADLSDKAAQNRFLTTCDMFDNYCIAQKIDPVVVINIDDGGDELECYYVDNNDHDLAVKEAAA